MPAIIPLVASAIPAVIGAVSSATQGGGGGGATSAADLEKAGYQKFVPGAPPPDLKNYFQGYAAKGVDPNAVNTGQLQQDRSGEMSLADALRQQSLGQGPSVAQEMLTRGTNANLAQSMGLLASQRNSPGGLAAALAANAAAGQESAGQSAALRAQEQQAGQQGLANELGTIGGQDMSLAQMEQQTRQANAEAQNNASQYNSGVLQNLGTMVNQQYDYSTTQQQQEQDNLNAAIAKQNGAAALQQAGFNQGLISSGINTGEKAIGSYFNSKGAAQALTGSNAAGGVVGENGPETRLVGEEGPEIILPVGRIADGTKPIDPNVRALLAHPDFQKALAEVIGDGSIPDRDKQLANLLASRGAPGGFRGRAAA